MSVEYTDYGAIGGFLDTDMVKMDISDIMSAMLIADQTVLKRAKGRAIATNPRHQWFERHLNPATFTATFDGTNTLTISDPSTTAEVQRIVRKYGIVQPDGYDFMLQFDSDPVTGANTVSVYDGTASAVSSATTFTVVSMPHADEDDPTDDISRPAERRFNFTQIFQNTVAFTRTRLNSDEWGYKIGKKEFASQLTDRTRESKRELDTAVIRSVPSKAGGAAYTEDDAHRTMAGIIKLIKDPDLDGTDQTDTVLDAGGDDLTIDHINDLVSSIWEKGGADNGNLILLVAANQARKLAGLNEAIRRADQKDTTMGYRVERIQTEIDLELPVVIDRNMPKNCAIVLDTSAERFKLVTYRGDSWVVEKVELGNPRIKKFQLSGQFSIELRHADEAHGIITNLAT